MVDIIGLPGLSQLENLPQYFNSYSCAKEVERR